MFRLIVITAIIGIVISSPVEVKKVKLKHRKIYSLNGIVGGQQPQQQSANALRTSEIPVESSHVRYAPQDPFASADEHDQDILSRSDHIENIPQQQHHHQQHQQQQHQHPQQQQEHHHQYQQKPRPTTTTTHRPHSAPINVDYDELNKHQAQHAHYQFDSSVHDDINDSSQTRSETRDGLKVTGMYSYSDGFYHRTVHYIADENGYRIVKENAEKIGEGPKFNADGVADVQSSLAGGYSIKIDDRERNPHYVGFKNVQ